MACPLLFITSNFSIFGKEQPVADTTISGQISSKPLQASTSSQSKTAQKANTVFDILLALFQSGGLSGKILPGVNGEFEIADGASLTAGANGQGKKTLKTAGLEPVQNKKQGGKAQGADPDLSGITGIPAAAEKAGTVNLIASLNSGGKASAGHVPANAVKTDSPAVIKAMSRQDAGMSSAGRKAEKGNADATAGANKTDGIDLKTVAAAQDGKNFRTDLADAAGQKNGISAALPEQAKSGRDAAGDRNKTGPKAPDAENSSSLKGAIQDAAVKGAESAALHKNSAAGPGAEDFRARLKESAGERTAARPADTTAANSEAAKAAARDDSRISGPRAENAESGAAGRFNSPAETGKGTEARADREAAAAPRGEAVKPGQALSGGIGIQAASGFTAVSGENTSGEAFNQSVVGQVSGGTVDLYRNGGGRVRLSLNPPELGSVDMDLIVDRNGMKLVLFSESGEVRNVLQANMDQLRSSLHDQGMNRFDILVQDRPASDSGGWHAGNSGRESMSGGSSGDGGQFSPNKGENGAPARPTDNGAAAPAAGRENSNGELSVFA